MKLTNNDVQAFAQAEFNTFDLSDFCLHKDIAIKELRDEIVAEWDELNSNDVMKSRHDYFKITDTKTSDYSERLLDLGGGKKIIYGIRHMGRDRDFPFIQLKPNFTIKDSREVFQIDKDLKDELMVFKPLFLSFWSAKKMDVDSIGATYLVTTAREMKELAPWSGEKNLNLHRVADDSYYDWYKNGYEKLHNKNPELEKKVTLNSRVSMKDSREQGLLYEVFIEGEKIGLISGERSSLLGHQGIYFHEIFIDEAWRGKGLAKAMQRKFLALNALDDDFIWGTIDDSNLSSYKTALSNGRKPIRFECFVKAPS